MQWALGIGSFFHVCVCRLTVLKFIYSGHDGDQLCPSVTVNKDKFTNSYSVLLSGSVQNLRFDSSRAMNGGWECYR